MTARQFGPVVAPDAPGQSSLGHDAVQHARDPRAGEAGVHVEGQALARVGIDDAQNADRASARQAIRGEVERPALIRSRSGYSRRANARQTFPALSFDR